MSAERPRTSCARRPSRSTRSPYGITTRVPLGVLEHRAVDAQLDDRAARSRERRPPVPVRRRSWCGPGSTGRVGSRGSRSPAARRRAPARAARARSSSSRNGRRAVASATTCTAVSPRVIATWKMRRSSSMSSASACGISPSCAPSTTTYGHSMPLTRCTVDSATPSSRGRLVRGAQPGAQPRFERGGIGFEGRDRDERVEVVAVAGVGRLAREVEGGERGAEPDVVADAGEELVGGRAAVERAAERVEVVAERLELGGGGARSARRPRAAAAAGAIAACVRAAATPPGAATGSDAAPRARGRCRGSRCRSPAASASRR